jgi:outer membrane protein assembly factor BamB
MRGYVRAIAGLIALSVVAPARAHDFRCTKSVGFVETYANGAPRFDGNGLPLIRVTESRSVLRVQGYPSLVGFDVALQNVASRDSVVLSAEDSLADLEGVDVVGVYGAEIASGTRVAPGATVHRATVVRIGSYDECLALGGAPPVAACVGALENRFTVFHDSGSTECRARLVCEPQEDAWVGVKAFGGIAWGGEGWDIAVAGDGEIRLAGEISLVGDPVEPTPLGSTPGGFVATLDAAGNVVAARQFGTPVYDRIARFAESGDDEVIAIVVQEGEGGVVNLDLSTGAELWSTAIEGRPTDLALDSGDAYVTSFTRQPEPPNLGVDGFVTKVSADGAVAWTHPLGVPYALAVAALPAGGVYVLGMTEPRDVVVARLDAAGNELWRQLLATQGSDTPVAVAVTADGDAIVVFETDWAAPVPLQTSVVKLRADGTQEWIRTVEGYASALAIGPGGAMWLLGDDGQALVVRKLDAAGNSLWSTQFSSGPDFDWGTAIAVDAGGNAYVTGGTEGWGGGALLHPFVAKIGPEGVLR